MSTFFHPHFTVGPNVVNVDDLPGSFGFISEPVIDLGRRSPTALYLEFLARFRLGSADPISANTFVRAMEASGDAAVLDLAMLDFVLESLSANSSLIVGCNISPYTIDDAFVCSALIKRLESASDCAPRVILEITRSALLDEIACAGVRLKAAKRLGCRIAVNDFGPKASRLPVLFGVKDVWDIIKLSKECFGESGDGREFAALLSPSFKLAASLAPIVVVKGIETDEHLASARMVGARYGQGWHLPSSAERGSVRSGSHTFEKIRKCLADEPFLSRATVRQAAL